MTDQETIASLQEELAHSRARAEALREYYRSELRTAIGDHGDTSLEDLIRFAGGMRTETVSLRERLAAERAAREAVQAQNAAIREAAYSKYDAEKDDYGHVILEHGVVCLICASGAEGTHDTDAIKHEETCPLDKPDAGSAILASHARERAELLAELSTLRERVRTLEAAIEGALRECGCDRVTPPPIYPCVPCGVLRGALSPAPSSPGDAHHEGRGEE